MSAQSYLFTSESVSEGHPDKVCDQISDAILDALLAQDPRSRVACESLVTTGQIVVSGEITTTATVDYAQIARNTVKRIGYNREGLGFSGDECGVMISVHSQSPDIARGVDSGENKDQGAGDQGMMFGYACNETPELMPVAIQLAQELMIRHKEMRNAGTVAYLRPDAKSQVTIEYGADNKPIKIHTVVVSTQHDALTKSPNPAEDEIAEEQVQIKKDMIEHVIKPVLDACPVPYDESLIIHVNPTGRFVVGGPHGDTGLTGRKIIVDTYGGMGRHGGGAFSGKDPSKVDRSAAYASRWIAKNVVAGGAAERCEVQVSYAIGWPEPISVNVNTFGTGKVDEEVLIETINKTFDLRPAGILESLNLRRPIYEATAAHGHFGRTGVELPWEQTQHKGVFAALVK